MVGVAKDKRTLSKRVSRFLDRECRRDTRLAALLGALAEQGKGYLFGGILRDIAFSGIKPFASDIDIVYVGGAGSLVVLAGDGSPKNKFGGFRISTDRWVVDLWEARETWAFRNGVREYTGIESLLDTTITNWESVLYDLQGGGLICRETYFEELGRRYLDVVCDRNPNLLGMYVRLLKAYVCKDAVLLSGKAAETIAWGLRKYSLAEVHSYEKEHYGRTFVSAAAYSYLRGRTVGERLSDVALEGVQGRLSLDG